MDINVLFKIELSGNGRFELRFEEDVSAEAIKEMRLQNDLHRKTFINENRVYARRWATGSYS